LLPVTTGWFERTEKSILDTTSPTTRRTAATATFFRKPRLGDGVTCSGLPFASSTCANAV
jgi:hypothetical protein